MLEVMVYFESSVMTLDKWCVNPKRGKFLLDTLLRAARGQVSNNGNHIISLGYGEDVLQLTENDTPEQRSHAATLYTAAQTGTVHKYLEKVTNEIRR